MSKFGEFYDIARKLYLESRTLEEIKELTGVSVTTLSKWKIDGEWEQDRAKGWKNRQSIEERLAALMEKKMSELESMPAPDITAKHVDQISKFAASIERLRTKRDPLGATLMVIEELQKFLQAADTNAWNAMSPHLPKFFEYMRGKNGQV